MNFNCSDDEEGLRILQLRKWAPSEFPYNPLDFREGFLSPTRELLLLLSHNFEALLLPLVKVDQCMKSKEPESNYYESFQNPPELSSPSISGTRDNISSTSESVELDFSKDCTSGITFPRYSNYGFISDVNSVAWGICVDKCDQHEDTPFQDLLFVSGNHGVVVHAFPQFYKTSKVTKSIQGGDVGQGTWVDWGPSTTLSHNLEVQEESKLHFEASREMPNSFDVEAEDDLSASDAAKIWLRTFLTKVETLKSGDGVYTRFPKCCSKDMISFRILDQDSQLLDFLFHGSCPVSLEKENGNMSSIDPQNNRSADANSSPSNLVLEEDNLSDSVSSGKNNFYKCTKVFSGDSHRLVGFAISLMDPVPVNTNDANERKCNKLFIAVARLVNWGIEWVCSVKLEENADRSRLSEWTDFSFSHTFLTCLSASGLISFYGATTGEHIASLDVIHICQLGYCPSSDEQEIDSNVLKDEMHEKSFHHVGSLAGDYFSFKNLLPQNQHLGLGLLVGWEVGAAEIGYQRALSNISAFQDVLWNRSSSFIGNLRSKELLKTQESNFKDQRSQYDSYVANSYNAAQIMDQKFSSTDFPSRLMRKVFLPPSGSNEDDVICFSPFGITRLMKRCSCTGKSCEVVHSDLHFDFIANDDISYNVRGREASVKGAVGCNFHGFLYLVTEEGLSVVLPSLSVSSHFYPVEAIGYRLPSSTNSMKCQAGSLFETEGIKNIWAPWKVEILDKVLLYEGPEEADQLCLENGTYLWICK
ncbi:hypothetical protein Adt_04690 [Abeliophyllum distichum]|uniref:Uncharacterized protein n=1 Tax=Abeliophyllum distichum TaxID=126358 RepID=A0ABD1V1Z7_9LAMI